MKHIRFYRIPLLAAAAFLLPTACNDEGDDPAPGGKFTLELTVDAITDVSARLAVTPSDDTKTYFAGAVDEQTLASYDDDLGLYVATLIDLVQQENPSLSKAEAIRSLVRSGKQTVSVASLTPETAYLAFAVGLNEKGEYTSEPARKGFTTTSATVPAAPFAIAVDEVTTGSVKLTVTPEDAETTYYYDIVTRSDYDLYEGDIARFVGELLDYLEQTQGITTPEAAKILQKKGTQTETIDGLPAATAFVAFAIGLDDKGSCSTEPAIAAFETLPGGDPAECTFTVGHPQIYDQSAVVEITPSDHTVRYFYITLPASMEYGDEELAAAIRETLLQLAAEYNRPLTDIIRTMTRTGICREIEEELERSTDYITYVYAMDETTGEAAGPVFRSEFTTKATSEADFSVEATDIRWFRGSELAELDPKYAGIADGAYLLADVRTEGDPKTWYISLSAGDKTDPEAFPDDSVIDALMYAGTTPNKTEMKLAVQYGDATFLGVAMDAYGQMSAVYREKVSVTEEGASPIGEFPEELLSSPQAAYSIPMRFDMLPSGREMPTRIRYSSRLGRIVAE